MSADSIVKLSSIDARMKEAENFMQADPPEWEKAALCWKKVWDEMGSSDVRAPGCLYRATLCYLQTDRSDRKEKKWQWTQQITSRLDHLTWVHGCQKRNEALNECRATSPHMDLSKQRAKLDECILGNNCCNGGSWYNSESSSK